MKNKTGLFWRVVVINKLKSYILKKNIQNNFNMFVEKNVLTNYLMG
jgi:hypothetical protein